MNPKCVQLVYCHRFCDDWVIAWPISRRRVVSPPTDRWRNMFALSAELCSEFADFSTCVIFKHNGQSCRYF